MQALDGLGSGSDLITGEEAVSVGLGSVSGATSGFGEIFPMLVRGEAMTGELEPELATFTCDCLGCSNSARGNFAGPCSRQSESSSHMLSSLTSSSSSL